MKRVKKCITLFLAIILILGTICYKSIPAKAQGIKEEVDGSYLLESDYSEVQKDFLVRGAYLKSGSSTIRKAGTGKIGAGGTTIAQSIVSSVGVNVRVERLVNGSWEVYTTWSTTRYNAASATTSKTLSVPTGYYYRTHCFHVANSDASSSVSGGIWI